MNVLDRDVLWSLRAGGGGLQTVAAGRPATQGAYECVPSAAGLLAVNLVCTRWVNRDNGHRQIELSHAP